MDGMHIFEDPSVAALARDQEALESLLTAFTSSQNESAVRLLTEYGVLNSPVMKEISEKVTLTSLTSAMQRLVPLLTVTPLLSAPQTHRERLCQICQRHTGEIGCNESVCIEALDREIRDIKALLLNDGEHRTAYYGLGDIPGFIWRLTEGLTKGDQTVVDELEGLSIEDLDSLVREFETRQAYGIRGIDEVLNRVRELREQRRQISSTTAYGTGGRPADLPRPFLQQGGGGGVGGGLESPAIHTLHHQHLRSAYTRPSRPEGSSIIQQHKDSSVRPQDIHGIEHGRGGGAADHYSGQGVVGPSQQAESQDSELRATLMAWLDDQIKSGLSRDLSGLKTRVDEQDHHIHTVRTDVEGLRKNMSTTTGSIRSQLQGLSDRQTEMAGQISRALHGKLGLDEQMGEMKVRLQEFERQTADMRAELEQVQSVQSSRSDELHTRLAAVEDDKQRTQEQLDALQQQMVKREGESAAHEEDPKYRHLTEDLARISAEWQSLAAELERVQSSRSEELQSIRTRLAAVEADKQRTQEQLDALQQRMIESEGDLAAQIARYEEHKTQSIQNLGGSQRQENPESTQLAEALARANQELERLSAEMDMLTQAKGEVEAWRDLKLAGCMTFLCSCTGIIKYYVVTEIGSVIGYDEDRIWAARQRLGILEIAFVLMFLSTLYMGGMGVLRLWSSKRPPP